jgi:hypothetical protein
MKQLIKQILKEETEKSSNDLFEIIVKQDIIKSDTRRIDRKAINQLISKLVGILKKCTIYIKLEIFNMEFLIRMFFTTD